MAQRNCDGRPSAGFLLFPRPTPQHANALSRKFAERANNPANARNGPHAGPSKSSGQFTLLAFPVPLSAQRMQNTLRPAARPLHSIRPSCLGHLLHEGQLPLGLVLLCACHFKRTMKECASTASGTKLVRILRHENNVKFHLDLIFHLDCSSRDADRSYSKGALLEFGRTQVVTVPEVHVDRDRRRLPMQS